MSATPPSTQAHRLIAFVRPSRWAALAVATWWGWRLLGLRAMRAFDSVDFEPLAFSLGLIGDVAMIVAHFALVGLAAGIASQRPRRLALAATACIAVTMSLFRIADTVTCYFGLSHMSEGFWFQIGPGALGHMVTPPFLAAVAVVVAQGVFLQVAALRHRAGVARRLGAGWSALPGRRTLAALVVLVLVPTLGWPIAIRQHPQHWALIPEVNIALVWARSSVSAEERADRRNAPVAPLTPAAVAALKGAGLIDPAADAGAEYPLIRTTLGRRDKLETAPEAAKAGIVELLHVPTNPGARPPNVILILMESFSAGFYGPMNPRYRGLMPNLEGLAGETTLVHGFHNVTSPTAAGLVASLCAALPSSSIQDLDVGKSVDDLAAYRCLADVLREHGYTSHFARGASKVYGACEATLRGHGFDGVYGREDISARYAERPQNSWGFYDDTLAAFLIEEIDALAKQDQPFFFATLTVDTHIPGFPTPGCSAPERFGDSRILDGFFCSDRAIGSLIAHLKETGLWQRSLVLITGDHAILPTEAVHALLPEDAFFGTFAPMPLIIHDPLHRLPAEVHVQSGQLDLVPTILTLLGAPDMDHTFMGWPIFGERRDHPLIVGRSGRRLALVATAAGRREMPLGVLGDWCEADRPLLEGQELPLGACELDAWFTWLDGLWRSHRLYPDDRYHGGDGANASALLMKWHRYDAKERGSKASSP